MLHGTLFLPGRGDWNESLATFVGYQGAALFFAASGEARARAILDDARRRELGQSQFARFLEPFLHELETLDASARPRDDKLRLREQVFARLRSAFARAFPTPPGHRPSSFATGPLNNAVLAGHAVYHRATPEHARLLRAMGYDLAAFIRLCKHAVEDKSDPIGYLAAYPAPPPP
jgi:predicted aminopeptidase